ncbi:MAG TPA: squalene/phytoene synthase family protein, partial [Chthoniobacterales bacterium]|nr:squalene/phytoene synthase family protein [Chthoniobacterales bacterium]
PHQLKANVELARPLLLEWRDRAWNYLRSAWAYVRAIRPVRVRFACALPVLIGARTLHKLDGSSTTRVKISRPEVYWLVIVALMAALFGPAAHWIGHRFGLSSRSS